MSSASQMNQLMDRLRYKRQHSPSLADIARTIKASMGEKRLFLVDKSLLRRNLETLHKAFKVTDYSCMLERLEILAQRFSLKLNHDPQKCIVTLTADLVYIQVVLLPNGRVKDVQVSSNNAAVTNCPEVAIALSESRFEPFIEHIEGLSSVSAVCLDKKMKSKLFLALQSLETDLSMLSKLQSTISSIPNYIHKSPLGILLPRNGGIPMKMVYFVGPYDLLNENSGSSSPMTVEAIIENNVGCSVTLGVEASDAHKLQMMPLMSINHSAEGKSLPSFSTLSSVKSCVFPAVFVLQLKKPLPISLTVLRQIQQVTDLEVVESEKVTSLHTLLLQFYTKRKTYDASKGLHVPLPDQRHTYFFSSLNGSSDCLGALVKTIPFLHPTKVPHILQLLRQQVLFNTVLGSCISRRPYRASHLDCLTFEVCPVSMQSVILTFEHPSVDAMATAELDLNDITAVQCKINVPQNASVICSNEHATRVFQRCLSIPITMRSVLNKAKDLLKAEILRNNPPQPLPPVSPKISTVGLERRQAFIEAHVEGPRSADRVMKNPMLASLLDQENNSPETPNSAPMLSALLGSDSPYNPMLKQQRKPRKRRSNSERSPINSKRKPSDEEMHLDFDLSNVSYETTTPISTPITTPTLTTPTVNLGDDVNPFLQESHVNRLASSLDKIIKKEEDFTNIEDGRKEGGGKPAEPEIIKMEPSDAAVFVATETVSKFNPTDLINSTNKLHRQKSHDSLDLLKNDFSGINSQMDVCDGQGFSIKHIGEKRLTKSESGEPTTIKIKLEDNQKERRDEAKPPITVKLNKKILKDSPLSKSESPTEWVEKRSSDSSASLTPEASAISAGQATSHIITSSLKKRINKDKLKEKKKRSSKHNNSDREKRKRLEDMKKEQQLKKQKIYDFDSEINQSENFRVEKGPIKSTTIKITKVPTSSGGTKTLVTTAVSSKSPSRTSPIINSPATTSQLKVIKSAEGSRDKAVSSPKVNARPGPKVSYNRSKSDPQGWGVATTTATTNNSNSQSSKVDSKLTRNPSVKLKPLNLAHGGVTVTVSAPTNSKVTPSQPVSAPVIPRTPTTPSTPSTAPKPSSKVPPPPAKKKGSLSAVIDKLTKQQHGPSDRKETKKETMSEKDKYDAIRLQIIREGNKPSTPTKDVLSSLKSSQGKMGTKTPLSGMKTIPKVPKTTTAQSVPQQSSAKSTAIPGRKSPSVAALPNNKISAPNAGPKPSVPPSTKVPVRPAPATASPKVTDTSTPRPQENSNKSQAIASPPQVEQTSPGRAPVPTIPLIKQTKTPPPPAQAVIHSRDPRTIPAQIKPPVKPPAVSASVTFTESPASPTPENRGPSAAAKDAKTVDDRSAANRHFLDAVTRGINGAEEEEADSNHVKSDAERTKTPSARTESPVCKAVNSSEDKENKGKSSEEFKAPTPKAPLWNGEEPERSRIDKFRSKGVLSPRSDISSPEDGLVIDIHSPATPRDMSTKSPGRLRDRSLSPKSPAAIRRSPIDAPPKSPALSHSPSSRKAIRSSSSPSMKTVRPSPRNSPAVMEPSDIEDDLMDAALGIV